jgi:hypothetical protein
MKKKRTKEYGETKIRKTRKMNENLVNKGNEGKTEKKKIRQKKIEEKEIMRLK